MGTIESGQTDAHFLLSRPLPLNGQALHMAVVFRHVETAEVSSSGSVACSRTDVEYLSPYHYTCQLPTGIKPVLNGSSQRRDACAIS
jgi:hypothetical protein